MQRTIFAFKAHQKVISAFKAHQKTISTFKAYQKAIPIPVSTFKAQQKDVSASISTFKAQQIPVLEPGQEDYRKAIATSNLLFRFSRPECVVQPRDAAQVQAVVNEARARGIRLTIKCNGHSYAGHSTAFSGISLDLRSMRNVNLDIDAMTVTMDAGCQWGNVYETLILGKHDGYIINGGRCPTVGVSGFILGGGLGPFTRSFGMGADTLAEATLVTASGDLVTVSETDPPTSDKGRLFWALRGAGGANFGVVVQMKLHVQQLRNRRGNIVAGRYQWFPKEGLNDPQVVATMDAFYTTPWPDRMTIDTTWICDLRSSAVNKDCNGVRFNISFDGTKTEYDRIIAKYIRQSDLCRQLQHRVLPEKSTRFLYETLAAQWFEETERAYPSNKTYELYSSFVFSNSDAATLASVTAAIRQLMDDFRRTYENEQVNFLVTWIHSGGKTCERSTFDTAYFWRDAVFHTYVTVEWVDKWMERDMRLFLAKIKRLLRPLSLNKEAAFINFPDRDFPTKFHERAYFGDNKDELRRVKQIWDPNGFFNWSQGVRRPGDPEEDEDGGSDGGDDVYAGDRTDKLASEQWDSSKWVNKWKYYETEDLEEDLADLEELGYGEDN